MPFQARLLEAVGFPIAAPMLLAENSSTGGTWFKRTGPEEWLSQDGSEEIAHQVQERLFKQCIPKIPGMDLAGACRPAQGVGGDYYDMIAFADARLGLAVGDVSGKGISAALLMASLRALLHAIMHAMTVLGTSIWRRSCST